ncbi:MAG: retron system putative HNH endonuclease [bacterium]|nr:retron system putative HNH endonuclease [bacterium]
MKHIIKGDEPQSFTIWKALQNDDWQPTYDNLSGQEKKDVKDALIQEQGTICCYCETKLTYNDSHIEHLVPQSNNEEGRLDFANMLCSCQQQLERGEPLHCGNSKGDDIISITPLILDCESKFTYTEDGYIGYIDTASKQTIKHLQLDIDKLNKLRKNAINSVMYHDPIEQDTFLTEEEIKIFVEGYLKKKDGSYNEFYTTIKYLFG